MKLKSRISFFSQLFYKDLKNRESSSTILRDFYLNNNWQQVQQGTPDIPLLSSILHLILGDPTVLPGQKGYIVPQVISGSSLGSPPRRIYPENLNRRCPGGFLMR
ncbi:hypothetical protein ILYODFUR_033516 [Ilyodon furcidens]|uniref:Uncharacterized protein n=1 Tax=Ilyodon furcidens TaxID=33524 RepID=A0ABV0U2N5_9TELE